MNLRRLEEIGLNASGPANPRFFDGWMLGFTPGKQKRGRSINPFYGSSLPLETKLATCRQLYAAAGLPFIIRLTPFVQPPDLEDWLAARGYERFDDTLVMAASLADWRADVVALAARANARCIELDPFEWTVETQHVRSLSDDQVRRLLDRQEMLRLESCGLIVRRKGVPIAWGLAQIEDGWVGLYNIETRADCRRMGLGRRITTSLLDWAHQRGASAAYLQVTAVNEVAIPLYASFGFSEAYRYWYRAEPKVVADERR